MRRLANVSVDLDGLIHYHRIHALTAPADPVAIHTVALPRFLELFARHGIRATFFVITEDLQHAAVRDVLRDAQAAGHELASHTHRHPYNLREWSDRGIAAEIADAEEALQKHLGVRPLGFRTPGYNVDTRIVRILAERGYTYDSSVFPCPPYYLAKAAVMGALALKGTPSGSSMTDPATLFAPLQPYRPSRWNVARAGDRKHSLPLWEIPIGVTRIGRAPVIGTSVGALPVPAARALAKAFGFGQQTVQFEMHGIDLLGGDDPGVDPSLAARQPDLRRSWQSRYATFDAFFAQLGTAFSWTTLADLADQLTDQAGGIVTGA